MIIDRSHVWHNEHEKNLDTLCLAVLILGMFLCRIKHGLNKRLCRLIWICISTIGKGRSLAIGQRRKRVIVPSLKVLDRFRFYSPVST